MTYVESTLGKGEKVLYLGKVSWWSQWLKVVLAVLFAWPGLCYLGMVGIYNNRTRNNKPARNSKVWIYPQTFD